MSKMSQQSPPKNQLSFTSLSSPLVDESFRLYSRVPKILNLSVFVTFNCFSGGTDSLNALLCHIPWYYFCRKIFLSIHFFIVYIWIFTKNIELQILNRNSVLILFLFCIVFNLWNIIYLFNIKFLHIIHALHNYCLFYFLIDYYI